MGCWLGAVEPMPELGNTYGLFTRVLAVHE